MSLKDFISDAQSKQISTYFAAWLYATGKPVEYVPESNADYIAWITAKHAQFRPLSKHLNSGKYHYEFIDWLEREVETV